MVSISAIPSDYVEDHDRPTGLLASVDWSPKLIDPHFEVNSKVQTLRLNAGAPAHTHTNTHKHSCRHTHTQN